MTLSRDPQVRGCNISWS